MRALIDTVARFQVKLSDTTYGVEHRMPLPEYGQLIERAATLTGEPSIALVCGYEANECAFDLMAPLISHVPTLRHAIREMSQFQSLAFAHAHVRLSENAGVARLCCEFPRSYDQTDRSVAELMVGSLLRMLRLFGGTRADVACFEHKRPPQAQTYRRIFEGAERFGCAYTGLEFAASLLDRPHLHANPELQTFVHAQAEQRLRRIQHPTSFVDRLRAFLRNQPAMPDMEAAAEALGMSSRSLRRRLTEEGISFRALYQDMQKERACTLLRNPELTIQHTAASLGFTDTGAFHRAFKRWTGMTPSEYRRG